MMTREEIDRAKQGKEREERLWLEVQRLRILLERRDRIIATLREVNSFQKSLLDDRLCAKP